MSERDGFLERLLSIEVDIAARPDAGYHGLTIPDAGGDERWSAGQVWAHMAEFIPYWTEQVSSVIASDTGEPVPFGRTKADLARRSAVAAGEGEPVATHRALVAERVTGLREFLSRVDDRGWAARGQHPTLGVMTMVAIVEDFLVGHLEEHLAQLDLLDD